MLPKNKKLQRQATISAAVKVKKPAVCITHTRTRATICFDLVTNARSFKSIESRGTQQIFALVGQEASLVTRKTIKGDIMKHFSECCQQLIGIFACLDSR